MTLSLLVHLLVLFFISVSLYPHATVTDRNRGATTLEVRLVQSLPTKKQTKSSKKFLTARAPAPYKITQPSARNSSGLAVDQPHTSQVDGIGFPGAVVTPWPGHNRSINPFFRTRSPQLDAERIYYQQAMEAQAKQKVEQQAQFMVQTLQQLLIKLLNVHPVVTGQCVQVGTKEAVNNHLVCDYEALSELLRKDEQSVHHAHDRDRRREPHHGADNQSGRDRADKATSDRPGDGTNDGADKDTKSVNHFPLPPSE